jgi:hypothetical protein
MSNAEMTKVVTGRARLSYVHLFTPHAHNPGQEPKYSVTILVPKTDTATKARLDTAIQTAIQDGISSKWNGVKPPILSIPVYDGDGVRPSDGMPFGRECKGHWVLTASSKQSPQVVDLTCQPIINQSEIYSGIYGRVSVKFFPYNANGKKGVGVGLNNVQKWEDGEPLGGRSNAASDFGDLPAPQPTYQQPVQQYDPITGQPL